MLNHTLPYPHPITIMRHLLLSLALLTAASPALAQEPQSGTQSGNTWTWSDRIAPGQWVIVRSLNGPITVERATGDKVEVTATKHFDRGRASDVRFEVARFGQDQGSVVICAIWEDGDTECDENGYRHESRGHDRSNNVEVEFRVRVPAGVRVGMHTVNGDVSIDGATAQVRAGTVNGSVAVTTAQGPVDASTVNGGVDVRIGALPGDDDMSFSTVNGSVRLSLPTSFGGEVDLRTVNGSFSTDWPMTITGRMNPRHLHATIGTGTRRLKASTVNGDVVLRKNG